ncbi:hypothetical protein ASALC70_03139 [Alcanivorax sp. ALC70]|nr:hypothetical protein ASALC70_03139 [Alcanivorax sp. ALC70]
MGLGPAAHGGPQGATGEESRHVEAVEAAPVGVAQAVDGALAEHHIGGHAKIQHHRRDHQQRHRQGRARLRQQRQPEGGAGNQHGGNRGRTGEAPVRQAPGDGRRHRPGHAGQTEQGDAALAETVHRARQQQRHRGPEQTEGTEQEGLIQGPPAQDRGVAQQPAHGQQQAAITRAGTRPARRHYPRQHQAQRHHQQRREHEHRLPVERLGECAGHRPCQHDAQHQAAHHRAHHLAAPFRRRQVGRVGHQNLHRHRAEADAQGGGQEGGGVMGEQGGGERQGGEQHHRDHQAAVLHQVAQRHHQQQAGAVAHLGHGDDQSGGPGDRDRDSAMGPTRGWA